MLPELGRIGPVVIHTYTVLLDVAFLVGLIALARRGLHTDQNPAAWVDVGLIALLGGIMGGRAAHVAVHWSYFSNHLGETYRVWLGGLDWHGAVAGGIPGLLLGARLRGVGWVDVLDVMSWVLPVGSILGSLGCLMSRCGYGREVATLADYPLVIASELPDIYGIVAPRLNSQLFAMAAGAMALLVAVLLLRLQVQAGVTFWIVLVVLSLGFFGVGFTRGEAGPLVGSLLLDQVLDLVLAGGGLFGAALVFWLTGSRRDAAVQATTPAGPNLGPQPIPPPEE